MSETPSIDPNNLPAVPGAVDADNTPVIPGQEEPAADNTPAIPVEVDSNLPAVPKTDGNLPSPADPFAARRQLRRNPRKQEESAEEPLGAEVGRSFEHPSSEFAHWDQIRKAVNEDFIVAARQVSREELRDNEPLYYELVQKVVDRNPQFEVQMVDMDHLVALLRKHQFGYGVLEDYLTLIPDLEDIWFNRFDNGFYYAAGSKHQIQQRVFDDTKDMVDFIQRIANDNGLEINTSRPAVDATLRDGSRLNAVLEPIAVDGPKFVIRKHRETWMTVEQYVESGAMPQQLAEDLERWVGSRANIVVSGGTGSGKTTLLNCLCNTFIDPSERIAILETNKEMQVELPDTFYMVTRDDAFRTKTSDDDIGMDSLIKQTLRQRPDRIIVGELRGAEAYPTLKAWNSGHGGSFCTVHADDCELAVNKLEQLCLEAEIGSEAAIQKQIGGTIDFIVQIQRLDGGERRITEVVQVLTPRKYRQDDAAVTERVKQLYADGQMQSYSSELFLLPIYQTDLGDGHLVKVNDAIPVKGKQL